MKSSFLNFNFKIDFLKKYGEINCFSKRISRDVIMSGIVVCRA